MGAVSTIECEQIQDLRPLVSGYPYLFDGQYFGEVPQESLAETFLRRSSEHLRRGTQLLVAWRDGKEISGLASVQQLGWDSRHFGISMARLELVIRPEAEVSAIQELIRIAVRVCVDWGATHLSCRQALAVQKANEALAGCSFRPVGIKLTLRAAEDDLRPADPVPGVEIRDFTAGDAPRILELAGLAVSDSRFHRDGRFPLDRIAGVYENWVQTTWERKTGQIRVAERRGDVVGFLAADCVIPAYGLTVDELAGMQAGFIGLVAVDPRARGLGIAKRLISESTQRLFGRGCDVAYANVMLSNDSSVNTFFRAGFKLKGSVQEWHLWL